MTHETQHLPEGEYEAHVIEFAFREILLQEYRELSERPLTPEEEALLTHAEGSRQQQLDRIARSVRRHTRAMRLNAGFSAALKYVAIFLLVTVFSFSTALAVSPSFRVQVIEFLTVVTNEYVRIGPETAEPSALVPDGWAAEYFPSYIPAGYELVNCYSTEQMSKAVFLNSQRACITYMISANKMDMQVNAENAICEIAEINDHVAYLYTMDSLSVLTWHDGEEYHTFTFTNPELMPEVVESLVVITSRADNLRGLFCFPRSQWRQLC